MSSGKVLLGVVAGAAAGVVFGMLIAPRKGSATRKRIARTGAEYAEEAKDKFNEYIDAVTEEYDTVKEGAKDFVAMGKEKAASVAGAKRSK
ncbi:MAG: YtxH domain-containing protein [Bacteroidota bacterium]|jgi:gas vesicle protein